MGIVLAILLPVLVFFFIYHLKFSEQPFGEFFNGFKQDKLKITLVGVWALVSNIALFTYYVNTNKDRTAKGVFAVTLVYGIGVLLAKVLI